MLRWSCLVTGPSLPYCHARDKGFADAEHQYTNGDGRRISFACEKKLMSENQCGARFPPPPSRTNVAEAMLVKRLRRTCRALRWPEATRLDGPTVFAALPPSRFALWRDKSPRQGGPDLLLLERACGEPVEDRKRSSFPACEAGCSTPRRPQSG